LQFKDETYEIVTRWTAETKIAYRPHAKAPGSKSHVRYEKYGKATTVGQSLAAGSYPIDWCYDFEHGFIKVKGGPVREQPVDISKGEEGDVTAVDKAINHWYQRELAKMLGMKVSEISDSAGSGESAQVRALRLLSQRDARLRLEAADREGRLITDDEVFTTLKTWPFLRNDTRKNVMQPGKTWVFSDTLGLLRDRIGDLHLTASTRRYPQVTELLTRWLTDRLPEETKNFTFTSMNVNCNYAAAQHRDNGNFGPSFIKAFGDFSGGELNYWPDDAGGKLEAVPKNKKVSFDLKKGLALFNGNCAHSVDDFSGARYSIVYFTLGCHAKVTPLDKTKLKTLGFPFPAADADPFELLAPPKGYGIKGVTPPVAKKKRDAPPFRFFDAVELAKRGDRLKPKSAAEVQKIATKRYKPENQRAFYGGVQRMEARLAEENAESEE